MHGLPRLREVAVVGRGWDRLGAWERPPSGRHFIAHQPKLDLIAGAGMLGVVFEAGLLEVLHGASAQDEFLG